MPPAFSFDDIPSGNYKLDARAMAVSKRRRFEPGEMIAQLKLDVVVPGLEGGPAATVDLGELTLEAFEPPISRQ